MPTDVLRKVAEALAQCCREGRERDGLKNLYAPDAVSVEAAAMPGGPPQEVSGVEAIQAKHDWWDNAVELHSFKVEGPFHHGDDRFALVFDIDITMKHDGERSTMREVAVYTVLGGKITREEFFYDA